MNEPLETVEIFDTTLRDGEQTPGVSLSGHEKLQIARYLQALGVDVIEAGFPATSEDELRAVKTIARELRGPTIAALARTHRGDIDAAWESIREAQKPRIHLFISTSDIHLEHMLRMSRERAVEVTVDSIKYATRFTDDVQFSAQDATRTDVDFLVQVLSAALKAGATVINVPDTVGYATADEYRRLFETLSERLAPQGRVMLSAHTHDDLGGAATNALAAVAGGARQIECTVNGVGERAGNCALEEVVMALHTRGDIYQVNTNIRCQQLYRSSRLVSSLTGIPVQPNKAVVGENAFAHEAGIHQDGVLKHRATYEVMRPEDVGFPASRLVLGKHSGRHALRSRLQQMGYDLTEEEFEEVFSRFKQLPGQKAPISEHDLEAIVDDQLGRADGTLQLEYLLVTSGNQAIPSATVRLQLCGEPRETSACGNGPVDAIFRAIDSATGINPELVDYRLESVTDGTDALGNGTVVVKFNSETHVGRGLSPDVLEASALAYVNALDKCLMARPMTDCSSGRGAASHRPADVREGRSSV